MNARELFPILDASDVERLTRFYEEGLGATRSYRWPSEEVGPPEYVYLTLPPRSSTRTATS